MFTFDVEVTDAEAKELIVSHIGSDNYQGGLLAGESIMKVTGDKGQIAIITYPEVTSCIHRRDGFMDYLKEHNSKLQVVTELTGKGNRNDGYAVATDILQSYPNLVGIFAINDPSALGAYAAIAKAGKLDQIRIVGFDASPAGKRAVLRRSCMTLLSSFLARWPRELWTAFVKYLEGGRSS